MLPYFLLSINALATVEEHIIEMILWSDQERLYGIQFVTNMGRISPQYGGEHGTPTIARSRGGVLTGFSSMTRLKDNKQSLKVIRLEASNSPKRARSPFNSFNRESGAMIFLINARKGVTYSRTMLEDVWDTRSTIECSSKTRILCIFPG